MDMSDVLMVVVTQVSVSPNSWRALYTVNIAFRDLHLNKPGFIKTSSGVCASTGLSRAQDTVSPGAASGVGV